MIFKEYYNQEVRKKVYETLKLKNIMQAPRIVKIVLNVGAGEAATTKGILDKVQEQVTTIAGQKAVITKARKSVSAFKIRLGLPIGVKVTLRGEKMYSFLEKLVKVVIPSLKDFRGLPESCVDKNGNLNIGFPEQTIFPEIDFDKIDKIRGIEVTVVTNAKKHDYGITLFETLGIPFKK